MSHSNAWKSGIALLVALGLVGGAIAPLVNPAPVLAQTTFPDVPSNYWAAGFIQALAQRGIIVGFAEDGTFRPEEPVTRAQFAAMINKAFQRQSIRPAVQFTDVPSNYWGYQAIQYAYTTGFMAGYPGNTFQPNQNIPRAQVLVSLSSGLNYASTGQADTVLLAYNDAAAIPGYARPGVAAATERRIVVNYPEVRALNPNRVATRAEVAAFIYQALVSTGDVAAIPSPYIVGQAPQPTQVRIPAGTAIPVRYDQANKILLSRQEPSPVPLTLSVARNIVNSQGAVLIPAGSQVTGQLQLTQDGAQFVGRELVFATGERLSIAAASEVITTTETITKGASVSTILRNTALGAAAAAGISAVTGDRAIATEEVLIGVGAGALSGVVLGRDRIELIAINPNTDLNLTLQSDLVIRQTPQ